MSANGKPSSDRGNQSRSARRAIATWRRVNEKLASALGARGLDALYKRSLELVRAEYPFLGAVENSTRESPALASLLAVLARQPRSVALAAGSALLESFRSDLECLIGKSLSDSLLRDAGAAQTPARPQSVAGAATARAGAELPLPAQIIERLMLAALRAKDDADTARRRWSEDVHASHRDPLTDIPNRALFLDRLQSAITMARRRISPLAILFIDLDGFKEINDSLGHATGDQVLKLVARRLTATLRDSDCVGRYGGDEFVILLADLSAPSDAVLIARKIIDALALPANCGDRTFSLSASVGISQFPYDGNDAESLIDHADAAMYRAKRSRPGSIACHGGGIVDGSLPQPPVSSTKSSFARPRVTTPR
jgi:diguanylate cyclase (GGDEF)-like protein